MVRVGGGWVALDEFLVKNDPCRGKFSLSSCQLFLLFFSPIKPVINGLKSTSFLRFLKAAEYFRLKTKYSCITE